MNESLTGKIKTPATFRKQELNILRMNTSIYIATPINSFNNLPPVGSHDKRANPSHDGPLGAIFLNGQFLLLCNLPNHIFSR